MRASSCADPTTLSRLNEVGLEVTGQRLEPGRAVLACRSWIRVAWSTTNDAVLAEGKRVRNLINYLVRSLLESGGFRPGYTPDCEEPKWVRCAADAWQESFSRFVVTRRRVLLAVPTDVALTPHL